jgi:FKBP-type peptidyl-prolyl cis-trans isomerase 2
MNFRTIALLLLIGLLATACKQVGPTDLVTVTYTGAYQNGTIFDTNDPVMKGTVDVPDSHFTPLLVSMGKHMVVPGFEKALLGMRVGEKKSVTINGADAYGSYDPAKTLNVPKQVVTLREARIKRMVQVPKSEIKTANLSVGQVIESKSFLYNVTAIGANVSLYILNITENPISFDAFQWKSKLTGETPEMLIFEHQVQDGDRFVTDDGPYNATINSTHITLHTLLQVGQQFQISTGLARVTRETTNSIIVDFNHPLAGQTLVFNITVNNIGG